MCVHNQNWFRSREDVDRALAQMMGFFIRGEPIRMSFAKPIVIPPQVTVRMHRRVARLKIRSNPSHAMHEFWTLLKWNFRRASESNICYATSTTMRHNSWQCRMTPFVFKPWLYASLVLSGRNSSRNFSA